MFAVRASSPGSLTPLARGPAEQERSWLTAFLLIHFALRAWQVAPGLLAAGLTATVALGFRAPRVAMLAAMGLMLAVAGRDFPLVPNHLLLEITCAWLLAALGDTRLALSGVRWLALLVLFWSGVQKVLAGTWLHAEFLSVAIARDMRFRDSVGLLLPEAELARLVAMGPSPATGSGPWRLDGAVAWLARLVWLAELMLPALLLWPRTRRVAAMAALAMVVGFELVAREVFFGGLMVVLLSGFLDGRWLKRLVPVVVLLELLTLGVDRWHPEWGLN